LRRATALGLVGVVLLAAPAGADDRVPPALHTAIAAIAPASALLAGTEVGEDCGEHRARAQLVRGDFNGDGLRDYAALVRAGEPRSVRVGAGGAEVRVVPVWFVVFLGRRDEGFDRVVLVRTEAPLPADLAIALRRPGRVWEYDRSASVRLTWSGIEFFYCGKAAAVYYWSARGRAFRSVATAD